MKRIMELILMIAVTGLLNAKEKPKSPFKVWVFRPDFATEDHMKAVSDLEKKLSKYFPVVQTEKEADFTVNAQIWSQDTGTTYGRVDDSGSVYAYQGQIPMATLVLCVRSLKLLYHFKMDGGGKLGIWYSSGKALDKCVLKMYEWSETHKQKLLKEIKDENHVG